MSASLTQLIGGSFQDAEGNLIENGYLTLKLSQDASVAGVGTICSGIEITIQLDSNGNVASSTSTPPAADQFAWANGNLSPVNTFYKVTGYTAEGQRAFGPNNQQIGTGSVFNLDAWVPNKIISWFPSTQPLLLEVNGTEASSQTLQNLVEGSNVTLTDLGGGEIEISSNGSGGISTSGLGFFFGAGVFEVPQNATSSATIVTSNNEVRVQQFTLPSGLLFGFQFVLESEWTISRCSTYLELSVSTCQNFSFGIYDATGTL